MSFRLVCLAVSWAGATGTAEAPPTIEVRPVAISLDVPPAREVQRACVICRRDGGGIGILSVAASDPAIVVDLREDPAGPAYVVTATLPAGYRAGAAEEPADVECLVKPAATTRPTAVTPPAPPYQGGEARLRGKARSRGEGKGESTASSRARSPLEGEKSTPSPARLSARDEARPSPLKGEGGATPVEIVVKTDLASEPVIRIPIRVGPARDPTLHGWLTPARAFIGHTAPVVTLERMEAGQVTIGPSEGKVTALMFWAHWCGHCDRHVPILERVRRDYADRDVRFQSVTQVSGDGTAMRDAIRRWNLQWPIALDQGFRAAREYGVGAFPVVFLIGPDGTVEAVHGRWSNHSTGNGLDHLEMQLRVELDLLLDGKTRADFPDWEKVLATPPDPPLSRGGGCDASDGDAFTGDTSNGDTPGRPGARGRARGSRREACGLSPEASRPALSSARGEGECGHGRGRPCHTWGRPCHI